jgi:hypothetical protein
VILTDGERTVVKRYHEMQEKEPQLEVEEVVAELLAESTTGESSARLHVPGLAMESVTIEIGR